MPPKNYKRVDPAANQKLLTAARSIVSVLCASAPENVDLLMAQRSLENAERELTAPASVAPLLEGAQQ